MGDNGAEGTRTPDLLHAMQAFSQLNYGPCWSIMFCPSRALASAFALSEQKPDSTVLLEGTQPGGGCGRNG